ncbi:hypothetical protein TSUD_177160 [Trifolium subterraneum]|uniref:Integrase catalytic domain-containing protein n=1 Tax=Trifolium subterraneum TaxID=3900 RepID=A0A2Z6NU59_TRISU|nr:hypothetical protein TSUD_177160 [Trifolium subterraneum]
MVARRAATSSDSNLDDIDPNPQLVDLLVAVRVLQEQNLVQQQRNEKHQRLQDEAQARETELRLQLEERERELRMMPKNFQPFSEEIQEVAVPRHFREPTIDSYDGSSDPQSHVSTFQTQMFISGVDDALSCKIFGGTLKDVAHKWIAGLPARSVTSFEDVATRFVAQFAANSEKSFLVVDLFDVQQRSTEPLKNDLARFNNATLKVTEPNEDIFVMAFEKGLSSRTFSEALTLRSREIRGKVQTTEDRREKMMKGLGRDGVPRNSRHEQRDRPKREAPPRVNPRDENFTPLTKRRSQIHKEVMNTQIIKRPPPNPRPMGDEAGQWCDYHRAYGHTTDNCRTPRMHIEKLIQEGYLGRYVQGRGGEVIMPRGQLLTNTQVDLRSVDMENRNHKTKSQEDDMKGISVRPRPAEEVKEIQIGAEPGQKNQGGNLSFKNSGGGTEDYTQKKCRFICMQRKRKMSLEKQKAMEEETQKLVNAKFIREVCPKDVYPLPSIDQLLDNASGYGLLSFMDAYSGYNQIRMHLEDEEKTAFMIDRANFCYKVMPFGLKNVAATYQWLMDKVFKNEIGKTIEVYVNDMAVKSAQEEDHQSSLSKMFRLLRKHDIKLNPEKCSFGVQVGKFLGFMLTRRGIKVNPEKCKAIMEMKSPASAKDVQKLTGRIASLTSSMLVQEEGKEQKPVHFTSKVLHGVELRYQKIEKVALTLLSSARKLRPYFQSHTIIPRGAIKVQALADFVVEMTKEKGSPIAASWILSVDGSSNLKGSGAGVTLEGPYGVLVEQSFRFEFKVSNNQTEYEALVAGMHLAVEVGVKELEASNKGPLTFENSRADLLARLASTKRPGNNKSVIQETLARPSIDQEETLFVTEELESWMGEIIRYLKENQLSAQEDEALKIKKKATKFVIIADQLFKRGFSSPLLKCLAPKQAKYVTVEVHEGTWGSHIGGRALASKVLQADYYWPTTKEDCAGYVNKCDKCQRFSNLHQAPPEHLSSVVSLWPFFKWGVDILGPFLEAVVATITAERIRKFYWRKIICRFGLPRVLVTDNGTQFASSNVADFCKEWGIQLSFTSVEHPQANGQAESTDKIILQGLKKRLEVSKRLWVEELPMVLWSYHTTPYSSTQETPFKMVYGSDYMIPIEINEPSARVLFTRMEENSINLLTNLDLQEEVRARAHLKEECFKRRAARRYDSKVKKRIIKQGELVLRRKPGVQTPGKLFPRWERQFRVKEEVGK